MNIIELLDRYPDLQVMPTPATSELWAKVFLQATGHTRRLKNDPILNETRPNEGAEIKKYRNANRRLITQGDVNRFISKCSRIFEVSGLNVDNETLGEALSEFLESEPFYYVGQYSGLNEFIYRVILSAAIEDPNGLLVVMPINPNNADVPPSYLPSDGGLPRNEPVYPFVETIAHNRIVYLSDDLFGWRANGDWVIDEKRKTKAPFYYYCDSVNYYRVIPRNDTNNKIEYIFEIWYTHNLGFLPLNIMPGILSRSEDGTLYNESILHGYFEVADEFKTRFSDNQAINVQHAYPKVLIASMPCQATGCRDGIIKTTNKDGTVTSGKCGTCGGTGRLYDIGPYGQMLKPDNTLVGGQSANIDPNPIQYVSPPIDILNTSYDNSFDLLTKARKQIGLDLLLDSNESGVAKNARLEDLQDMLGNISNLFADTVEMMLKTIEGLLVINPSQRVTPKLVRPKVFRIKDSDTLREEFEQSLPFDRYERAIELITEKYRGDATKLKRYDAAFQFAPELLLTDSELNIRLARVANSDELLRKRDYTMIAVNTITDQEIDRLTIDQIKERILQYLDDNSPIVDTIPLFQ